MKPENSIVISEDGDATALTNFQWYGRFQKPKDGSKFQLVNLLNAEMLLGSIKLRIKVLSPLSEEMVNEASMASV